MESVLIVSSSKNMTDFFAEMLSQNGIVKLQVVSTCGEARRLMVERTFDLCIINAPLPDEVGDKLSLDIIGDKANQVILVAKQEMAEELTAKVEDYGVFTVEKPISRQTFWTALKMAGSAFKRLSFVSSENAKLKQKLDEIKLVSRAKILLMSKFNISEEEAHKKIEKQAMNTRKTRLEIANSIIKKYEN